jgi:hypothetical protein
MCLVRAGMKGVSWTCTRQTRAPCAQHQALLPYQQSLRACCVHQPGNPGRMQVEWGAHTCLRCVVCSTHACRCKCQPDPHGSPPSRHCCPPALGPHLRAHQLRGPGWCQGGPPGGGGQAGGGSGQHCGTGGQDSWCVHVAACCLCEMSGLRERLQVLRPQQLPIAGGYFSVLFLLPEDSDVHSSWCWVMCCHTGDGQRPGVGIRVVQ